MAIPGPLNSICDVPGIEVGNAEDRDLLTGVTVILPDAPVTCAVDHRGGAIGARETVSLRPGSVGGIAHAICLSGGSAYGLDAAGGVMHGLRAMGRGFELAGAVVPIVPSTIIFDLAFGEQRDWMHPPWWDLGTKALVAASSQFSLGNAGAGLGATAGPLKGGLGSASLIHEGTTLGAIAVVNPVGSTVMPGTDTFWGWTRALEGEVGNQHSPAHMQKLDPPTHAKPGENTTLVVVATDAKLDRDQALRVAIMAQDGLAHAIRPVHSPLDGDTVFVLSMGTAEAPNPWHGVSTLGTMAADVTARAIMRGVYEAESLAGVPSYREVHGP
ncbi:MAG: P1 family peptidase [Paracoccaceae bacterium]